MDSCPHCKKKGTDADPTFEWHYSKSIEAGDGYATCNFCEKRIK